MNVLDVAFDNFGRDFTSKHYVRGHTRTIFEALRKRTHTNYIRCPPFATTSPANAQQTHTCRSTNSFATKTDAYCTKLVDECERGGCGICTHPTCTPHVHVSSCKCSGLNAAVTVTNSNRPKRPMSHTRPSCQTPFTIIIDPLARDTEWYPC